MTKIRTYIKITGKNLTSDLNILKLLETNSINYLVSINLEYILMEHLEAFKKGLFEKENIIEPYLLSPSKYEECDIYGNSILIWSSELINERNGVLILYKNDNNRVYLYKDLIKFILPRFDYFIDIPLSSMTPDFIDNQINKENIISSIFKKVLVVLCIRGFLQDSRLSDDVFFKITKEIMKT